MKKFLAVLAALGISSTAIVSVVACGNNNNQVTVPHKQDIATLFSDVDLRIDGKTDMSDLDAFDAFSNLEGVNQILETNNLSQTDFDLDLDFDNNYYTVSGMLSLTIKEDNANYTGSIDVIINPLGQTSLQNLDWITKTIDGTNTMNTAALAFQSFLTTPANSSLAGMVKIKDDSSFVAPTTTRDGSFTISANLGNHPYRGEVTITINKLIGLDSLGLKTELPAPVVNQQAAFAEFLKLNPEVSAYQDNLEITGYQAASVNGPGSLILGAKQGTRYSNTLTITIPELNKTDITTLVTNTTIQGVENMTKESAFQTFLTANSSWTNLGDYVRAGSFTAPKYTTAGTLKVETKSGTGFSGSLTVTINAIGQTDVNSLNLVTEVASSTTKSTALATFLAANSQYPDLKDYVKLDKNSFVAPTYNTPGSYTITANSNGKYTGSVAIGISPLTKIALNTLGLKTSLSNPFTDQTQAFNDFLTLNSQVNDLRDNVTVSEFTPSNWGMTGKLTISANADGKYTDSVDITIPARQTIALSTLNQTALTGVENMNQATAWQAFLSNNPNVNDLEGYVSVTFTSPDYNNPGSLVISANPNGKYTGAITIIINSVPKIALNTLGLKTSLSGPFTDQTQAFNDFLTLNSQVNDLRDNVTVSEFIPSNWGKTGKLTISANADGKYTDSVDITIPARQTIALSTLNQTALTGVEGMSQATAWQAFLRNNPNVNDLEQYTTIVFNAPNYNNPGSLVITANPNGKYTGAITITISAVAKINLSGLTDLVSEVANNTTKATALAAFLSANQSNYPDLATAVELDESSFTLPTSTTAGHYTIRAKTGNYKYQGSVEVTITKAKVSLASKITTLEIHQYISREEEVIAAVLKANPNSGVVASDLEVVANSFKPTTISTSGGATIRAVDSSDFVGTVNITIIAFPKDQELLDIIQQIKDNGAKNSAQIDIYRFRYFPYYSQQRLQAMVDAINTKYTVPKEYSLFDQRMNLLEQVTKNMEILLAQVVVAKDGLTDQFRYDRFQVFSSRVNPIGDNVLEIQFNLNFIWESNAGIPSEAILNVGRTIRINYSIV